MARDILTDKQWERLHAVLPPQQPQTGRPNKDHRLVGNGILWIVRTGAPWRDLPTEYGPWQTCSTRFYRWVKAGVWDRVLAALQRQADHEGNLDWSLRHVDGTMIRAHQHAAGALQEATTSTCPDEALGRSQGGFSTKIHLRAEGGGKPITLLVAAGQRHEQSAFEALMERGAVKRPGRGRPRVRPRRVAGDKGYSSRHIRRYLGKRGIGAVIARQKRERRTRFDKAAYSEEECGGAPGESLEAVPPDCHPR